MFVMRLKDRLLAVGVDEAHALIQDKDFRPTVKSACKFLKEFSLPTVLISATLTEADVNALQESLHMKLTTKRKSTSRDNIR